MELYYVISVLDRDRREDQERIYRELGLPVALTMLGRGTAKPEHLTMRGLPPTEKAVVSTVADREQTARLFRRTKEEMFIDIPGNGVMTAVPIKSVGGANILAYLTDQKPGTPGRPDMTFSHELILIVLNEGFSDDVMDAARGAGAGGGTVLSAKGTGRDRALKFSGMTLTDEKDVIMIVAKADTKAAIMQAILEKCGVGTPAGAICFSLPVSRVAGLRVLEDEEP